MQRDVGCFQDAVNVASLSYVSYRHFNTEISEDFYSKNQSFLPLIWLFKKHVFYSPVNPYIKADTELGKDVIFSNILHSSYFVFYKILQHAKLKASVKLQL